jgi:hypothetical protein
MLQMKYERRTCDAVVSDLQPVHYILLGTTVLKMIVANGGEARWSSCQPILVRS